MNIDEKPTTNPDVKDITITNDELNKAFDKLMSYKRPIMIWGFIILVLLVVFLGFAFGGLKVCNQLDGLLDSKFKCHPNYYNDTIVISTPPGLNLELYNVDSNTS
tara:strand:- start:555 stop:869 length:315 start_codon:yes stop_codon:yes gene_type:complete